MAQVHKTISISSEQDKFIAENNINVSKLVQNEIEDMQSNKSNPDYFKNKIKELERLIEVHKNNFILAGKFIESKGLVSSFEAYWEVHDGF